MTRICVRALVLFGCLALAFATFDGPRQAHGQSDQWDSLYDRIIRLEHEIEGMKAGGGPVPLNPAAGGGNAAVETQLRQVLGMLDEIRRTQRALELRLDQLEAARGASGSVFEQRPQAPSETAQNSFDFSQYQTDGLAELSAEQDVTVYREYGSQTATPPQVLGTLTQQQLDQQSQAPASWAQYGGGGDSLLPETVERAALDGGPLAATGSTTGATTGATTGGSADRLYQTGYESLLGRRFGDAEGSFKMFLDRYGNHPLASDAQYWLGETYYVQGDYKQAAQTFLKGYREHPDGRKAPDTLFKLALSLQQLEQNAQACSTFAEVAKKFPTAADVRNEALKEMQRAGC